MEDLELEEHLHKLGWLEHRPPSPYPRVGHVGEHVYCEEWQAFMLAPPKEWPENVPNENLYRILTRHRRRGWLRRYDAEICARIVCWLGATCGRCFISSAERLHRDSIRSREEAFVMQWAAENTRHHFLNDGVRTIEHLLARDADYDESRVDGALVSRRLRRWPRLTADTLEVVECLMHWLGSDEGGAFVSKCERKIEEINRFVRLTKQAEHKASLVALGFMSKEAAERVY